MIGKVLGRIEHPLEALSARGRCWFARPVSRADHFVPGAFVVGSDRLLDFRVAHDKESPALHVAARWRGHTSFKDLPYQGSGHRIGFQPAHRASRLHNLEKDRYFL